VSRGAGKGGGARLIAGDLARRALDVPDGVRPSEGRLREALFSAWQDRVPGSSFLDLFAGSGAVGLEAVSRGAAQVVCAEKDLRVLRGLEANARRLGVRTLRGVRASLPGDLTGWPARGLGPFDLIFADPPYAFARYGALVAAIEPLLAPGGRFALEHSARVEAPEAGGALRRSAVRRYGESALSFYDFATT
jgi:16S rRNA (guanine(966)-N(2))-methyltransferase RsmD